MTVIKGMRAVTRQSPNEAYLRGVIETSLLFLQEAKVLGVREDKINKRTSYRLLLNPLIAYVIPYPTQAVRIIIAPAVTSKK